METLTMNTPLVPCKTVTLPSPEKVAPAKFHAEIVWKNAIFLLVLHLLGIYSIYVTFTDLHPFTYIWGYFLATTSALGVSIGAHRFYTHRSFKANSGLRAVFLLFQTIAGQNCMYIWVRDHRQHHKHSDTSADPHDSTRGFFFSHVGWLMVRKHPDVIRAGKQIDMSDLEADKMVMFQKKYYKRLFFAFSLLLLAVPCIFWGETIFKSFLFAYVHRSVMTHNRVWLVNSAAHLYGQRPFDKNIGPVENKVVSFFAWGEGWHNYHHSYPWDYRTSELGKEFNHSVKIIDWLAARGWATDLRSVSHDVVMKKIALKGDGTHRSVPVHERPPPKKVELSWMPVHFGEKLFELWWILTRGCRIGVLISTYLLVKHYWQTPLPPSLN